MAAEVIRLRAGSFYAVVPGAGIDEPVFYERTLDGLLSAMAHAQHLSAGGATWQVTLTERRRTRVILRYSGGTEVTGKIIRAPYKTTVKPRAGQDLRPGVPGGKITEISRTATARKAGKRPRRNPNCPPAQWPGIITER